MQFKPADIVALGVFAFGVFKTVKAPKKWYWWLLAIIGGVSLIAFLFLSDDTATNSDSHNKIATTSANNSPAIINDVPANGSPVVNQNAITYGSNSPISQTVNMAPVPKPPDTKNDIRELLAKINPVTISLIDSGTNEIRIMVGDYGRIKFADLSARKDFDDFISYKTTSLVMIGSSHSHFGDFINDLDESGNLIGVVFHPRPSLRN